MSVLGLDKYSQQQKHGDFILVKTNLVASSVTGYMVYIKQNLSGSNTDRSFTTAVSNYDKIPVLQTVLSAWDNLRFYFLY